MTSTDPQEQIERIDAQLVRLLRDRARAAADARSSGEPESEDDVLDFWAEETEDLDMDGDAVEKVARAVVSLCRKTPEE